jgi:hypothetical protein
VNEDQSDVEQPDAARWTLPAPTGVAAVDDALQSLTSLDALPISAQVEHYETVHRRLQDALADLDGS